MISNKIGYMICETAATVEPSSKIIKEENDRLVAEVILQDMNVKNRNGRFYASQQMNSALKAKRLWELIETGNLYSENGHPMSKDISRQQTIDPNNKVCKIKKFWTDGDDIVAHVHGAYNTLGDEFNRELLAGDKPSYSLRALGTVKNTRRGAEVENITIITWDRVIYPSHERAYTKGLVTESAGLIGLDGNKLILDKNDKGLITPITNKQVIDYITHESGNIKSIIESFEILYDNITLLENGKVQLTDNTGSTFIIHLENHVKNQVMDYCYKRY